MTAGEIIDWLAQYPRDRAVVIGTTRLDTIEIVDIVRLTSIETSGSDPYVILEGATRERA